MIYKGDCLKRLEFRMNMEYCKQKKYSYGNTIKSFSSYIGFIIILLFSIFFLNRYDRTF
jgi:hypothetical protein